LRIQVKKMESRQLSNEEIQRTLLKLKWSSLISKKPEFIAQVIIKTFAKQGIRMYVEQDKLQVRVDPVTRWGKDLVKRNTVFVYEEFNGFVGHLIGEREANGAILCKVEIGKPGGRKFVTEILKQDLIITNGKEKN